MGRGGGLYCVFSSNTVQVTRVFSVAKTQQATPIRYSYSVHTQGYTYLAGKADAKTVS